ncbi:MAG: hypothetical protein Q9166_003926 [cf. Caloplaca sp. 2 TL-2023]
MGPPPAKRRRKQVVSSSEDEEVTSTHERLGDQLRSQTSKAWSRQTTNDHQLRALPTRLRSKPKPVTRAPRIDSANTNTPSSPKKPVSKPHYAPKDSKSSSLDKFFSAASHSNASKASGSQNPKLGTAVEDEDFIEDDSFDEELQKLSDPCRDIQGLVKQASAPPPPLTEKVSSSKLLSGSQVFRRLGSGVGARNKKDEVAKPRKDDTRPWADRYGPTSLEELAVHKKKVADVKDWLHGVFQGQSKKRMLILKGSSGVGKTATVCTLAKAMDFDILEWANPTVSDFTANNYISTTGLFDEFLRRSSKFTSLDTTGSKNSDDPSNISSTGKVTSETTKNIIMVEEIPNMFMSSSTALQFFRSSILRHLASGRAFVNNLAGTENAGASAKVNTATPLVIIVTESQVNSSTSISDGLTAHRLLGPEILNHPSTDVIEFNPIAPTFITKALNQTIQKEARVSGRRRVPGPSVLKRLSESGDVRNAVGSLEFLCLKGQDGDDWGGRVASKGKKGSKSASALTEMEEESLELVTQREASLGLFHAVGKVVYNKREGLGDRPKIPVNPPTQPPDHLPQHVRLKPSDVVVDELVDETGKDTQTFVAALHENYVPSCDGVEFLDTLNACIEYLSDSDILISSRSWKYRGNNTFQGVGADSLRQDEIAFHVGVRGLLFGLPCPVKRGGRPSGLGAGRKGGRGDVFKMFYPTSMRLGRKTQEVEELVERWMARKRKPINSLSEGAEGHGRGDEVASWGRRNASTEQDEGDSIGACITPTQDDMALEVLPYMALIERHRPGSFVIDELSTITKLAGVIPIVTEESPDETDMSISLGKGKPQPVSSPSNRDTEISGSAVIVEQAVGHLYLSDDDIED